MFSRRNHVLLRGSILFLALAHYTGGARQAHAQGAICQVATQVIRTAASACGTQIMTDPVGCLRRIWEENQGLIQGFTDAMHTVGDFVGEKVAQVRDFINNAVSTVRRQAQIPEGQSLGVTDYVRIAGAIVSAGLDGLRSMVSSLASGVTQAATNLRDIVSRASAEVRASADFTAMQSACGDSGSGAIAKFRAMTTSCRAAVGGGSCDGIMARPGCVRQCVQAGFETITQAAACLPALGRLASSGGATAASALTQAANQVKNAIRDALTRLRERVDQFRQQAVQRVQSELSELARRVFIAAARPMIGQAMSSIMRERPASGGARTGTSGGIAAALARYLASQTTPIIQQGITEAGRAVQSVLGAVFGTASVTVDGACAAATGSIGGVGIVLQPVCTCAINVALNFVMTRLADAIAQNVVRPALEPAIRNLAAPVADALSTELHLDTLLNGLLDRISAGGASGVRSALQALPQWLRTASPQLMQVAQSSGEAAVTAFVTAARTCVTNRATAGFLGTIDCLVQAVGSGVAAGGTAAIRGAFERFFSRSTRARILEIYQSVRTTINQYLPQSVQSFLGRTAAASARAAAMAALTQFADGAVEHCMTSFPTSLAAMGTFVTCLAGQVPEALREGATEGGRQIVREALRGLIDAVGYGASRLAERLTPFISSHTRDLGPLATRLRTVLTQAVTSGAQAFQTAARECPDAIEELNHDGLEAFVQCLVQAAGSGVRGGAAGGVREILRQALTALAGPATRVTELLTEAVGRMTSVSPQARTRLQTVIRNAAGAGAASYREAAGACIDALEEVTTPNVETLIGCLGRAFSTATGAAVGAGVRTALTQLIDGVTSTATQTALRSLLTRTGQQLTSGIVMPEGLRTALTTASPAALRAGATTFRRQATACLSQLPQVQATLGCIGTAAQSALQAAGGGGASTATALQSAREALRAALTAVTGSAGNAREVIGRLPSTLSTVRTALTSAIGHATRLAAASCADRLDALTTAAAGRVATCIGDAVRAAGSGTPPTSGGRTPTPPAARTPPSSATPRTPPTRACSTGQHRDSQGRCVR
jgi:hypothetical protein